MDVTSVTSPIGLMTAALKPQVFLFAFWPWPSCFLEPQVTIFGREGGAELALMLAIVD